MALTNAERQARFREKRNAELERYRARLRPCLEMLYTAFDRAYCSSVLRGLPDEPLLALEELARRAEGKCLILCAPKGNGKEKTGG